MPIIERLVPYTAVKPPHPSPLLRATVLGTFKHVQSHHRQFEFIVNIAIFPHSATSSCCKRVLSLGPRIQLVRKLRFFFFPRMMNQGPLPEAFRTTGLKSLTGTAIPNGDTFRLITTSSHVLPMRICPP
ncbi:hypothetical protein FOYG_01236 [Fusarium oxysporum NRRL 32931]|uniref:Uncharacterized protein n=1 Tax=Fusarium oxysporum NRRL 32931 TaxID=660029 RepID=W9J378_FUSOX|nr:hypothetical protein FOYG_01236 [Fusarium oxysporum NRRL 32931]